MMITKYKLSLFFISTDIKHRNILISSRIFIDNKPALNNTIFSFRASYCEFKNILY